MKSFFSHLKKKKYILATLIILFTGLVLGQTYLTKTFSTADQSFEAFTDELFRQEVSSDTISLHYTLANPASYGIKEVPITFGEYCLDPSTSAHAIDTYLKALEYFDPKDLSPDNKLTHEILYHYLHSSKEGIGYLLYQEPLSPVIGIHAQLPLLLSEYQLNHVNDVEIYLKLLRQTEPYFDSLLQFEEEKIKKGLFMPAYQVEEVISYCKSFIDMGNENYLISSFEERIKKLPNLSQQDQAKFCAQNEKIVFDVIYPSYQTLITFLENHKGQGTNDAGLCYFPNGKNYYEYMVQMETGLSESVPELQEMTLAQIQDDIQAMQRVLSEESVEEATIRTNKDFMTEEPSQILDELKHKTFSVFPAISEVSTEIKFVSSAMEEYLSPAFYMIPAIDNRAENVIYINRGQTVEGLPLYTTLAHEGYPGHLYQTNYFAQQNPAPIRSLLNFGGYVEGWATYTEMMSYYFAPLTDMDATLLQKNNSLLLGLYAYADMKIHYDGWMLSDTIQFFGEYGLSDDEIVEEIYELIIGTPGNYSKYYLGYLKIYTLKKEIAAELGSDFSQKAFHKAVLDIGPAPFDIVETYVKESLF